MVEFIEETHQYLIEGILTPSVSDILKYIFPNKYSNIPEDILKNKSIFGTGVHKAVECLEKGEELPELDFYQDLCLKEFKKLKEKHNIEVKEQETMVNYGTHYCGRFDMIALVDGCYSLCDIKTTAQLDLDSLSWQLSYYALAYDPDKYENKFAKLYAIWLPKKDIGKVVEVKRKSKEELLEKLKADEER